MSTVQICKLRPKAHVLSQFVRGGPAGLCVSSECSQLGGQ